MLSASDLAAYLCRIGYSGPVAPTRAVLGALHLLHPQAIPFENLDPLAGLPVRIALADIVEKLVRSQRGGYCFEQNTLFQAVLETIGFSVTPLAARVLMGQPEDLQTAQSHKLLHVRCEGEELIADVGFGGMTLTGPMRLAADLEQATPHEPYRLDCSGEDWWLRANVAGDWRLLYRFALRPSWRVDEEVANHYVATHPASNFTTMLRVARILPQGRLTLLNRRLTEHRLGATSQIEELADDDALRTVLAQRFGIVVADETWTKAVAKLAG